MITRTKNIPIMVENGMHFVADIPAWVLVVSGLPFAAFMWTETHWQRSTR